MLTIYYKTFIEKFDPYAPLKKISKNKLNFKDKPCKTSGLQKYIFVKNNDL